MKPRRNGPLKTLSDAEVLRLVARNLHRRARLLAWPSSAGVTAIVSVEREVLLDGASRLRSMARRVPLWTDRPR